MSQSPPEYGGCLWPLNPDCLGDEWDALSVEQKNRAHMLASATLTRLTGGRVRECPITIRPCKSESFHSPGHWMSAYHAFNPMLTAEGMWVNIGCCKSQSCSCEAVCSIPLPRPATRVDEVRVDGEVVDPANYFLHDAHLIWSGEAPCPFRTTQDLGKPDTEVGTLSITYLNSYPIDALGQCAAASLALEFAKSFAGSNKCRLPSNVRSINRQGVSMELVVGAFPDGNTGLREVDSYIALWNPNHLVSDARVWSPDMARNR